MARKLTPIQHNERIINPDGTATPKLLLHLQFQRDRTGDALPVTGGTLSGPLEVPDDAYSGSWNGSAQVPTKNAIYDKFVTLKFTDLSDVPSSYLGNAFRFPQVNSGGTGMAFVDVYQLPVGGAIGTVLRKFGAGDGQAAWAALTAGIISYSPAGGISSTDVQSAINELDTEKAALSGAAFSGNITVPGQAYGVAWSGSTQVPTKGDVYAEMETKQDALVPPTVQIPSLNAPWINYGAGFGGARYYKTAEGIVWVEGLIQAPGGSPTSGVVLFTLLPGYRPPDVLVFGTTNGGGAGRIDVSSNGDVIMQSGNTAFTSLAGISFRAA